MFFFTKKLGAAFSYCSSFRLRVEIKETQSSEKIQKNSSKNRTKERLVDDDFFLTFLLFQILHFVAI